MSIGRGPDIFMRGDWHFRLPKLPEEEVLFEGIPGLVFWKPKTGQICGHRPFFILNSA